jgi:hypothetical protein
MQRAVRVSAWALGFAAAWVAAEARAADPTGALDEADCTHIAGWAQDPDEPARPVEVHLYFDGPAGTQGVVAFSIGQANLRRADLCDSVGCDHGFDIPTPFGLIDDRGHTVFAYAIDTSGSGTNPELAEPRGLTCTPNVPPSTKRKIADETTFAAWGFDLFRDVLNVRDDVLDKMPNGPEVSGAPVVIKGDAAADVYLVDGSARHKVPGAEGMRNWRFDASKVQVRTAAEVNALTDASPLRTRPWLAKGAGATIYLLYSLNDAIGPDAGGPAPSASAGTTGEPAAAPAKDEGCNTGGTAPLQGLLFALASLGVISAIRCGRSRRG